MFFPRVNHIISSRWKLDGYRLNTFILYSDTICLLENICALSLQLKKNPK